MPRRVGGGVGGIHAYTHVYIHTCIHIAVESQDLNTFSTHTIFIYSKLGILIQNKILALTLEYEEILPRVRNHAFYILFETQSISTGLDT